MESKESEQQKQSFEFEPARFFESFVAVGKALLTRPRFFFQQIPQSAAIMIPGIFLVVCAFLAALVMANVRQGDANLFALLLFSNIFSGYVGSWILHLLIVRIFRSQAPFGATFRIIAYSS
ncbi:MAG: hypothetical protein GY850_26420, partial [bacterium]|nr:hypothetical protein [bacterium]